MKNCIRKFTGSLLSVGVIAIIAASANAATITVDRSDDTAAAVACTAAANDCSLRGALAYANANSGTTINVPAGNYALSLGELTVGSASNLNTIIIGNSPSTTIIRQTTPATRLLNINPSTAANVSVELRNLTFRDGETAPGNGGGGAIYAGGTGNRLNIVNCHFLNNRSVLSDEAYGGAIDYSGGGDLIVDQSLFDGNLAGNPANTVWGFGGAISYAVRNGISTLTVTDSTFINNVARAVYQDYGAGGAILVEMPSTAGSASATITRNRFINNQAVGTGATAGQGRGGAFAAQTVWPTYFNYNYLSGNSAPTSGSGVYSKPIPNNGLDARFNWWGCNDGPGNPGCHSAGDAASNILLSPRLVMNFSASPSSAGVGQQSVLTASLATDSIGGPVSSANLAAFTGLNVAFGNAVNGTLSVFSAPFNSAGAAATSMTITGSPLATADATFGNETETASVNVTQFSTTTTITADTPDPSALSQSVTISFNVGYSVGGPPPTGTVIVSDGTSACAAPVSAGQCTLAFPTFGNRVLTATYSGDSRFLPSTSAGEPHSVCTSSASATNTSNSGNGSLRDAVSSACDGSTVTFGAAFLNPQIISLSGGQILIDKNLSITGPGAQLLTIRNTAAASATSRVFEVADGAALTLSGATISGGNLNGNARGAAIYYRNGTLRLNGVVISGNQTSGIGGGLAGDAASLLEMSSSTVSNNTALASNGNGGGIYSEGTVRIVNSTIARNSASNGSFNGGGIFTAGSGLIANTTITDNLGTSDGAGGIFSFNPILLTNNLIAANRNNSTVADVIGFFDTNSSYNLVGNAGGNLSLTTANQNILGSSTSVVDPRLELDGSNRPNLSLNGGSTPSVRLLGDSPAIDKGVAVDIQFLAGGVAESSAPLAVDQRGQTRPIEIPSIVNAPGGNGSDIGSFELQTPTAAGAEISGRVLTADGRGIRNVRLILTDASGASRTVVTGTFGYYRFDAIATGETFTLSAEAKRYRFAPRILSVTADITDLDFIAPE